MRTRLLIPGLLIVLSLNAGGQRPNWQLRKATSVEESIELLRKVAAIARIHEAHYPNAQTQSQIRTLLGPLKTVDELTRFALLAGALRGGLAEEQTYDTVFEEASWIAIERLATIPGEDAHVALEFKLKPVLGADGHPSEQFRELIAKQKRLRQ